MYPPPPPFHNVYTKELGERYNRYIMNLKWFDLSYTHNVLILHKTSLLNYRYMYIPVHTLGIFLHNISYCEGNAPLCGALVWFVSDYENIRLIKVDQARQVIICVLIYKYDLILLYSLFYFLPFKLVFTGGIRFSSLFLKLFFNETLFLFFFKYIFF